MWLELSDEEYSIIRSALENCKLFGLNFLLKKQTKSRSPKNIKHTSENAINAAKTYFASSDTQIGDYVKWEENGDALVMVWQKVPKVYIDEQEIGDCGCNK